MPAKDAVVKKAIQEVVGTSRKGRVKVIRLVQKKHPEMGSFKIRRVYEREGFALNKRLRRRSLLFQFTNAKFETTNYIYNLSKKATTYQGLGKVVFTESFS